MTTPLMLDDRTNYGNRPGDGPLRPAGQSPDSKTSAPGLTDADLPSTTSSVVRAMREAITIMRDLWGGTLVMRAKTTAYLPSAPGELSSDYMARVMRAVLYNALKRTVEGLTGFVFRRDVQLGDDMPPVIAEHMEDVDLAGTHLDVFARNIMQDALLMGHAGILVDFPSEGGAALTLADEQRAGLRPYWVAIRKDDIVSWRSTVEQGTAILTQLVLRESRRVPMGAFGEREDEQYRVLTRTLVDGVPVVAFKVLCVLPTKAVQTVSEGVYGNQTKIPFVEVVSPGTTALLVSTPPLLDLALLNVAHYQMWSDYATSIHKTCVPIFFGAGFSDIGPDGAPAPLLLGPSTGLITSNPQAKAEYVSHTGAAHGSVKDALTDLKAQMGALGIAMLAPQTRAAETAEAKRLDKSTGDSTLGVAARALQDALEEALDFHAAYLKLPDGGSVIVNRDFDSIAMEPAVMMAYVAAAKDAGLPVRLLLDAWQAGGRIDPDVDLDRLEFEMQAEQAAKAALAQSLANANAGGGSSDNGGTSGDNGNAAGGDAGNNMGGAEIA